MLMRPWHIKLIKDNAKALLPFQDYLRQLKRSLVPYSSNPDNDRYSMQQGMEILHLLKPHQAPRNQTVLELGTGWIPIVPLLMHACGAARLILTDVEKLIDGNTIRYAKSFIANHADHISTELGLDKAELLNSLESFAFDYRCPFSVDELADNSVDVIYSRNVLEHISPPDLDSIFAGCRRFLAPGGLMCHIVDNSDHWQHNDKSISRINFLQYEDSVWRLLSINRQNYQNRLRHSDYERKLKACGFSLVSSGGTPDAKALADLESIHLAARFKNRPKADLAILTSCFVAKKAEPA